MNVVPRSKISLKPLSKIRGPFLRTYPGCVRLELFRCDDAASQAQVYNRVRKCQQQGMTKGVKVVIRIVLTTAS